MASIVLGWTLPRIPLVVQPAISWRHDVVGLIAGRAQGVTMPNLNTGVMSSVPVKLPPRKVQDDFARLTFPMARSREALTANIDTLRRTRNLLPPRLLSGRGSPSRLP